MRVAMLRRLSLVCVSFFALASCGDSPTAGTSPEPKGDVPGGTNSGQIVVSGGATQLGVVGTPLGSPVTIRVLDAGGRPVSGATVGFQVMVGGGSVTPSQATTSSDGQAQAVWTLGSAAGEQELMVSAMGTTLKVAATAAATPNSVVLQKMSGDGQTGAAGAELASALVLRAVDGGGRPVPGLSIAWNVEGGGSVPLATATTGPDGSATARWKLGASGTQRATATVTGAPPAVFDATLSAVPAAVANVRIQPDSLLLALGDSGDFNAVALDAEGNVLSGRNVTWTLTNPASGFGEVTVATLGAGGSVKALLPGRATVTATVEGVAVTAAVRVVPVPVATLRLSPDSAEVRPGGSVELFAVALDAKNTPLTGRAVTWATSDTAIATVGADGVVRGKTVGVATITATVEGITATARVRVSVAPPAPVVAVRVQPDSVVLAPGAARAFTAVATDANGVALTGRAVTWSISNTAVARLDAENRVVGVAEGIATVTATVEGVSGTATVRILPPAAAVVASVRVEPDSLSLTTGKTGDLNPIALDAQGNVLTGRSVTWVSSDSKVATVGTGGTVTAVAPGVTEILVTVERVTARVRVRVTAPVVASVRIQPDTLLLVTGASATLSAVATDAEGNAISGRAVTWATSSAAIASLGAGGTVTGVAEGTAEITATVDGVKATARVRVLPRPTIAVASVRIQPDSLVLTTGASGTLSAIALDAQGNVLSGRGVTWTTSSPAVASLGAGGTVNGAAEGTAEITATVEGVTATARVRVLPRPATAVASVRIQPDSLVLAAGASGTLSAIALDAQGNAISGRAVTWTTSNAAIASLGAGGTVNGVAEGTAEITATVEGITAKVRVQVVRNPYASVASVRIQPDSLALNPGATAALSVVALDAQGNALTGRAVIWSSLDPSVATIAFGGTVTAVAPGTTQLRASVEGVSGTITVRVISPTPPPSSAVSTVLVLPDSLVLTVGGKGTLTVVARDASGRAVSGRPVTWSTTSAQVASIGAGGVVTAVAAGTAQITATVDGVSASAQVRVQPRPAGAVATVRIVPDSLLLMVGQTGTFNAVALDEDGNALSGRTVVWKLTNPTGSWGDVNVATMESGGTVKAVIPGRATITATVEGVSVTASIRVIQIPVASLRVSPDSVDVRPGESAEMFAIALDADGSPVTGRGVAWTSSNPAVATISGGKVYGRAEGTTRITAEVEGIRASAVVRVRIPPPAGVVKVVLSPDSFDLGIGRERTFIVTATDVNGNVLTGRNVTWTTSDSRIASIAVTTSTTGGVGGKTLAVAEGTARITANVEGVTATAIMRVFTPPVAVATVRVEPTSVTLLPGDSAQLRATAYDAAGNVLTGRRVSWFASASYGYGARISATGMVTGISEGTVPIYATVEGKSGTATVLVQPIGLKDMKVTRIGPQSLSSYGYDASKGSIHMRFAVELSHAAKSVNLRVRSPLGISVPCGTSVSVSNFNTEFNCEMQIPAGSDPGFWWVDQVTVTASNGTRVYSRADLAAMETPGRGFDVFGAGTDRYAPEVRNVGVENRNEQGRWISFGLVDHITGVASSSATVRNLATGETATCTARSSYGVLARSGSHWCPLNIPAGGRWRIVTITTTDGAGNTASYTPEQIDWYRGVGLYTALTYEFTA